MSAVGSGVLTNRDGLVARGPAGLRELVLEVVEAGLWAADPAAAVRRAVRAGEAGAVVVDGVEHRPGRGGRVLVVGAGKASARIAATLEEVLGETIAGGIVIAPSGHAGTLRRIDLLAGGHPLPTHASRRAAARLMRLAGTVGPDDVVLACFTGGSSALACLPADGVAFDEKRDLHRLLLRSGAAIREVNTVRKHVSRLKGGRLAAALQGAAIVNLTVSDVAGDPLDAITDPTVPDTTTAADAVGVLHAYDLWDLVAPSIRSHLSDPDRAESPPLDGLRIESRILVTGADVAEAMVGRSEQLGVPAHIVSTAMEGESREIGSALAAIAAEVHDHGRPFASPCVLVGAGGETTVTLPASEEFGAGGPNQAAALGAALRIGMGRAIAAAFVDTDGMDGGTRRAGALVDGSTLERAQALGVDLRLALRRHRSSEALARIGDAIVTGRTGSNANDLFAIAVGDRHGRRTEL
jgi:glycerate 2-kinase